MSLTDKKSNWIWSVKNGDPIAQNQQDAELQMHDQNDAFTLDLTVGTGGDSLNPFAQSASANASTTTPAGSTPTGSSAGAAADDGESSTNRKIVAHGILMSLAFL